MQKLQFGTYTVELKENPLEIKIYNKDGELISTTGQASDGMLLTVTVQGRNTEEIDYIIHETLEYRTGPIFVKGIDALLELERKRCAQDKAVSDYEIAFALGKTKKELHELSSDEVDDITKVALEFRELRKSGYPLFG